MNTQQQLNGYVGQNSVVTDWLQYFLLNLDRILYTCVGCMYCGQLPWTCLLSYWLGVQVWAVVNSFASQCILSNKLLGVLMGTVLLKDSLKLFLFSMFVYSVLLFHSLLLLEPSLEQRHLNCYCCSVAKDISISWSERLKLSYDLSYSYFSCN